MKARYHGSPTAPADTAFTVSPSDSSDLQIPVRAIFVGTGGDLKITPEIGDPVTFKNLPSGSILPVVTYRVWATGTTATNLVALT